MPVRSPIASHSSPNITRARPVVPRWSLRTLARGHASRTSEVFSWVGVVAVSVLALEFAPAPYVWVAALWFGFLGWNALDCRNPAQRALWLNLSAAVLTLGAVESYFWAQERNGPVERYEGSYTTEYFINHDPLGYGPVKDTQVNVIKHVGDSPVYETGYTIDQYGLRVSPPASENPQHGSILFFGGSVTFGEGVNDEQTMPYRVGLATGGPVYNFAFHGYGPHQMLAALEHGLVADVLQRPPEVVIYQAIPAHVQRAAGLASWDQHGPKYVLEDSGDVRFAGHFDDTQSSIRDAVIARLERSHLYQRLFGLRRPLRDRDVKLFIGIVKAARDFVSNHFNSCAFHVLLWGDEREATYRTIANGLRVAGIQVHPIKNALPQFDVNPVRYELSAQDQHPNALAHSLIANYVTEHIVARDKWSSETLISRSPEVAILRAP